MRVSQDFNLPRISDSDLRVWYGLGRKEVQEFKANSGFGFMRKEIRKTTEEFGESEDLHDFMRLTFCIKKHLELFLSECRDQTLAYRLIIKPFILLAKEQIPAMPEEMRQYAGWYLESQLRVSKWLKFNSKKRKI